MKDTQFINAPVPGKVLSGIRWICAAPLLLGVASADPAVSGPNGKIGASLGRFDVTLNDALYVDGSVSFPLADAWGLQLDGMYAHGQGIPTGFSLGPGSEDFGGVGGHVFWRDPAWAMLGLESAWVFGGNDDTSGFQVGLEGEYYLKWITLGANAGYSEVDDDRFGGSDSGFYARFTAGCYPVDDLLINLVLETRYGEMLYGVEAEYETPVAGLSVFASAMRGEHDADSVFAGMRYYFGGESGLKNRHRRSDPPSRLSGLFAGVQNFRAEMMSRTRYVAPVMTGSSLGGSGTIGGGTLTIGGVLAPGSAPVGPLVISGGNYSGGGLTLGQGSLPTTGGGGSLLTVDTSTSGGSGTQTFGPLTADPAGSLLLGGGVTLPPSGGTSSGASGPTLTLSGPIGSTLIGSGSVIGGTGGYTLLDGTVSGVGSNFPVLDYWSGYRWPDTSGWFFNPGGTVTLVPLTP
ncbi:MAG: hypothetical protein J0M04_08390 [Verrucomicrobia bacterium]|nr:hypothetical protein [Verrucomicrobiota bacterium]